MVTSEFTTAMVTTEFDRTEIAAPESGATEFVKLGALTASSPDLFIAEAMRRAAAAGYYPAREQRDVDWSQVREWAVRVREGEFSWRSAEELSRDAIIVSEGPDGSRAIHAGQHRILGGLMGGNPVPERSLSRLRGVYPVRLWGEDAPSLDLRDLLGGW